MKFVLLLILLLTLIYCFYCFRSYTTEDLDNLTNEHSSATQSHIAEEGKVIKLIQDTTFNEEYSLYGKTLDLNGHVLTINNTLYMDSGSKIKNGTIVMDGTRCTAISANGSNIVIDNVVLNVSADLEAVGILVHRTVDIRNSKILVNTTNKYASTRAYGVLSTLLGGAIVYNSDITASVQYGKAMAVNIQSDGEIINSRLNAYSNYDSDEKDYLSYSIGCRSFGTLRIENSYVYGVHSGIDSSGDTFINGGTYEGFGHGGIYCSGHGATYYIYNCTIQTADMPEGYEQMRTNRTENGMYIGGGKGNDNMIVCMDGCNVSGIKYDVVLRGTSSEKNNKLYVSNCTFGQNKIRIDNNTHMLYVGNGCTLTDDSYTIGDAVVNTHEEYKDKYK
jgi:hypothetical protein